MAKKISYRGGHGIFFPSVFNILEEKEDLGVVTKIRDNRLCPDDSDSEPEYETLAPEI